LIANTPVSTDGEQISNTAWASQEEVVGGQTLTFSDLVVCKIVAFRVSYFNLSSKKFNPQTDHFLPGIDNTPYTGQKQEIRTGSLHNQYPRSIRNSKQCKIKMSPLSLTKLFW
jgi:hypothetical protein